MKKALVLTLAVSSVAVSFAQGNKTPKELPCAVMTSHKVNIKQATASKMFTDYKGRRYFFCCAGCPPSFKSDPAKYAVKKNSIPTPKAK
jgi:YHS domain-containing protein